MASTKQPFQQWKRIISQPRDHDKDAPKSEDYAWNRRQHLDQRNNRLANPERRKFRQINSGRDAQWDGNEQRNERRNKRSVNKRESAEMLRHRVPSGCGEKMNPNFWTASKDPRQSCQPVRMMSRTTASAIARVSHSNALSPKREGGAIARATDSGSCRARKLSGLEVWQVPWSSCCNLLHLDLADSFQDPLL